MMNREEYEQCLNGHYLIAHAARELVDEYCELNDIAKDTANHAYDLTEMNSDHITLEGDAYWRYGGHEHYSLDMPVDFIVDPEFRKKQREKFEAKKIKAKKKKEREEKAAKKAAEKEKREQYEKLKAEFEGAES